MAPPVGGGFGITQAPAGLGTLMFRMEVSGFEPVAVSLSRFGDRITNFRPFWVEYFAPAFYRLVGSNFRSEGSYVGGWASLSPSYAAWKAQHFPGKSILRRTDALYRSLTFEGGAVGPRGIFIAEEKALVLGTSVPYAAYHQLPFSFRSRGLLGALRSSILRRFLFLPSKAGSTFGRLLHEFAVDQADQAGMRVASSRAASSGGGLL